MERVSPIAPEQRQSARRYLRLWVVMEETTMKIQSAADRVLWSPAAVRFCSESLLGVALAVTSATVCTAQVVRTEVIPIGKISDLYGKGAIEVTVEVPHNAGSGEKALAIRVVAASTGIGRREHPNRHFD